MKIAFSKYHGAGNDFILIDNRNNSYPIDGGACIAHLCDRRFGIGADGVLCIERSSVADCKMHIFNADGSPAAMCGNGIRCVVDFLQENHIQVEVQVEVQIEAGERIFSCRRSGCNISVNLGVPQVMHWPMSLCVQGEEVQLYVLHVGVPHAVLFVQEVMEVPLLKWGKEIRFHPAFAPEGVNVNFAQIDSENGIALRTYERGVEAETLSCGTGAAAASWAAAHLYELKEPVAVKTRTVDGAFQESMLFSFLSSQGKVEIEMIGPAEKVFSGEIEVTNTHTVDLPCILR